MLQKAIGSRFFYGWTIVAACSITLLGGVWPPATLGVFFDELRAELGAPAAAVSAILSADAGSRMGFNLLGAWVTDRFGPRTPLILAASIGSACLYALSWARSLGQFYLLYAIAAVTGMTMPMATSVPQRWFRRRRGLAIGIANAGGGVGGLLYPSLTNWAISISGWRASYAMLAGVNAVLFSIAALLMVDRPERVGLKPYGSDASEDGPPSRRGPAADGLSWKAGEAMRSNAFLLLCAYNLFTVMPAVMISIHFIPYTTATGFPRATAAAALGLINIAGIGGSIFSGAISPRFLGWRAGMVLYTAVAGLLMLWLTRIGDPWMLWAFAAVFGVLRTGSRVLMLGALGSYFGTGALTALIGVTNFIGMAGAAIGPPLAGLAYDRTGAYSIAFLMGAVLWGLGTLCALLLRSPAGGASSGQLPPRLSAAAILDKGPPSRGLERRSA